jgi:hypothetical protein
MNIFDSGDLDELWKDYQYAIEMNEEVSKIVKETNYQLVDEIEYKNNKDWSILNNQIFGNEIK